MSGEAHEKPTSAPQRKPRRPWRWLQFRIKTLLLVLLVAALLLGWWSDRQRLNERLEREQILRQALRMAQPEAFNQQFFARYLVRGGPVPGMQQPPPPDSTVEPLREYWRDGLMWTGAPFNGVTSLGSPVMPAAAAVPNLARMLNHKNAATRAQAACTLGRFGADAAPAVGPLTALLEDPDATVRQNAAYALGEIGPAAREALPALLRMTKGKDMPAFAARVAIRIDPDADVADRLLELLTHSNAEPRRRAAATLAALRTKLDTAQKALAIARIMEMAAYADPEDRLAAARALAALLPHDDALTELARMFRDEWDEETRRQMARVLSDLDDPLKVISLEP